jgi:FkbM family methyltransferase
MGRLVTYYRNHGIRATVSAGTRHLVNNYYISPLNGMPSRLAVRVYLATHWLLPHLTAVTVTKRDGLCLVRGFVSDVEFAFPELPDLWELTRVSYGYSEHIVDKYTLPGFVTVEEGDTVVDVGAYVGAFTCGVANRCSQVISFEPSSRNHAALAYNVRDFRNVRTRQMVALDRSGEVELQIGVDTTDHSIINVDGESSGEIEEVEATTLDSECGALDIKTIDFLKVDAEGAEPEVLDGCTGTGVRKVAVDCGPERDGEPTGDQVKELLDERGYEIREDGYVVYGRDKSYTRSE